MRAQIFITILALLLTAGASFCGDLVSTGRGYAVQGFAWDSNKDVNLTVASTTIDMSQDLAWSLYAPASCLVRLMPTSSKGTFKQRTYLSGTWFTNVVNPASPFINFSGCTSGELRRH